MPTPKVYSAGSMDRHARVTPFDLCSTAFPMIWQSEAGCLEWARLERYVEPVTGRVVRFERSAGIRRFLE